MFGFEVRPRRGRPRICTATWPRRCSMARRRASMRERPRSRELFPRDGGSTGGQGRGRAPRPRGRRGRAGRAPATEPDERTVDHVPSWEEAAHGEIPRADPRPAPAPPSPAPLTPCPPAPSPEARTAAAQPRAATAGRSARVPPPVAAVPRLLEPLPEQPARLHRGPPRRDSSALSRGDQGRRRRRRRPERRQTG